MRSLIVLLLLGAVAVGGASDVGAAGGADDAAAAASAAVGASSAKSAATSKCASTCHDAVKKLEGGYQRLASDSLACFLPYQGGKTLGTADCCDRAELLLGKSGSLAECERSTRTRAARGAYVTQNCSGNPRLPADPAACCLPVQACAAQSGPRRCCRLFLIAK